MLSAAVLIGALSVKNWDSETFIGLNVIHDDDDDDDDDNDDDKLMFYIPFNII